MTLDEIGARLEPARGKIDRIYCHWTGAPYQLVECLAYHVVIDRGGYCHVIHEDFTECLAHTWRAVEELGLSVSDIYTHAEMAAFDGYGIGSGDPDVRWDLLYVPDYGDGGRLVPGGELIRGKTKYYRKRRDGLLCL